MKKLLILPMMMLAACRVHREEVVREPDPARGIRLTLSRNVEAEMREPRHEPVFSVELSNDTHHPVEARYTLTLEDVVVLDHAGRRLLPSDRTPPEFRVALYSVPGIEPPLSSSVVLLYLGHFFDLDRPGHYTVQIVKRFHRLEDGHAVEPAFVVKSNPVHIEIERIRVD